MSTALHWPERIACIAGSRCAMKLLPPSIVPSM